MILNPSALHPSPFGAFSLAFVPLRAASGIGDRRCVSRALVEAPLSRDGNVERVGGPGLSPACALARGREKMGVPVAQWFFISVGRLKRVDCNP